MLWLLAQAPCGTAIHTYIYIHAAGAMGTLRQAKEPRSKCSAQNIHPHTPISHGWPSLSPFVLAPDHKASHTGQQPHVLSGVCVMSYRHLPVLRSSCLLLGSLWCPRHPQRPCHCFLCCCEPAHPAGLAFRLLGGGAHGTLQGPSEGRLGGGEQMCE